MNAEITVIVNSIDRFRTAATAEQSQLAAFVEEVRNDRRRTPFAKTDDIKKASANSSDIIAAAQKGEETYLKETRTKLMERAFHPGAIITSSDRLAFRDASDRVSSLDAGDEDKAISMYESAVQVNDRPMIALLAKRAYTNQMERLLETHMSQQGPSKDCVEALQYIDRVENSINARFAAGFAYAGAGQRYNAHMS